MYTNDDGGEGRETERKPDRIDGVKKLLAQEKYCKTTRLFTDFRKAFCELGSPILRNEISRFSFTVHNITILYLNAILRSSIVVDFHAVE